jgi:antitoxin YefM
MLGTVPTTEVTMRRISQAELRRHFAKYMDEVRSSRVPLCVTRSNDRSVVFLCADEYESIMETLHLLGNPANSTRLFDSIAEANAGREVERDP